MKRLIATLKLSALLLSLLPFSSFSQTNIALNKPATASSFQAGTSYTSNLAFDGNMSTRWSSTQGSDVQWIYVDLGSSYNITNVNINWEAAYGKNYTIDVSSDLSTWTTIKTITGNTSTTNNNSVSGTGRYVRMHGTLRGTVWGYSIWEMVVYGTAVSQGSSGSSGSGSSGSGSSGSGSTGGSGSGTMSTSGKTYYVSTTDGDDSRSSTTAQSSSTPWKTISKVNSFFSSLNAGDQIAFKRGDTFTGTLTVNKSGSSSAPILIGAYGSGSNPIISGFTTVSSWTSVGSGRYTATVSGGLSTCNMVTRDGSFQAMGKMPKGNTGYYTASGGGSSSLTSSGISGLPSYVGGEVVWRAYHWVLWRGTVTSQSSTTVNFSAFASTSGGSLEPAQANYGFFFQNAPAACTQLGEWAYNSSHVLTMYFGSDAPTSHTIKATTLDYLVSGSNVNYLSFNNITFTGANSYIFNLNGCSNITINSCSLSYAGIYGIYGNGTAAGWKVTNNNINWSNSIGILASSSSSAWTITGNTVNNSGATAGMGGSGENQYFGIKGARNGSTVSSNTVLNTGYDPIMFTGTNNIIQNNYVDYFGFVKDDAGGIYCGVANLSGSKVMSNIITRGIGCPSGTPDKDMRAQGIYVDDGASNVEIGSNTVAFCGRSGIYCHNGQNVNMHNNTLYNNTSSIAFYNDGNKVSGITYQNNINFAKTSSQWVYIASGGSNAPSTYYSSLDNNHYCRPIAETSDFELMVPTSSNVTLTTWKTMVGKDGNSKTSPKTVTDTSQVKFFYNNTNAAATFSFTGTYLDALGTSYTSSVTLQPWTSVVLIYSSGSTTKAEVNTTEVVSPAALSPLTPVFTLYPNPVSDNFSVELTNDQIGQMKVDIVSVSGQIMRSLMLNKEEPSTQFTLPSNNLSKGVYFLQIQVGNWNGTKRFVKL